MFRGIGLDLPLTPEESEQRVQEYEAQLQKQEQERKQREYESSGVPQKFWREGFNTFETSEEKEIVAFDTVRQFADNPKNRVLILCGNNGNGKTHLGCSVIRQCGGEYITSSMLCMKYDSAIGYKVDMNREELIAHYSKIPMLVIDECTKYFVNEQTEKFLLVQIICMRYENDKPTVLITNANKESFIKFLGKSSFDRLTEVGTTLTFDWESKRKFAREEYAKPTTENKI